MKPDAYNYSRAKDDRARLLENWQAWLVVVLCVYYVSVYDICLIRTVTGASTVLLFASDRPASLCRDRCFMPAVHRACRLAEVAVDARVSAGYDAAS